MIKGAISLDVNISEDGLQSLRKTFLDRKAYKMSVWSSEGLLYISKRGESTYKFSKLQVFGSKCSKVRKKDEGKKVTLFSTREISLRFLDFMN